MSFAHLFYDLDKGTPKDIQDKNHYPLHIYGNGLTLYISGVTAGFSGDGPRGTLEIIKKFGIDVDSEEERMITQESFNEHGARIKLFSHTFFS